MNKTAAAILLLTVIMQSAEAQWLVQPSVTTAGLKKVKFIDRNTGWIMGQYYNRSGVEISAAYRATLLKTSNAGNSWDEQILENCLLHGIEFANSSIGWAVGETRDHRRLMYKTSDSGTHWILVDSSAEHSYYHTIQFIDELHGWIGGGNDTTSVLLRTSDGGASWQRIIYEPIGFVEIFFLDSLNGWNAGGGGKIYRTTNGGVTWQLVFQLSGSLPTLRRIRFSDRLHGCAVGGIGGEETKVWTSDGGVSWNVVNNSSLGSSLHGVWFTDAHTGWTVGGANAGLTIQKTTDGGMTWTRQQIPSNLSRKVSYFEDITFVSASEGWIVADSGVVLKTTNGGEQPTSAVGNQTNDGPSTFHLNQNYPNPFNPSTQITYSLPRESEIKLIVVDLLGREACVLHEGTQRAGTHMITWDARDSHRDMLPSGIYFCRLVVDHFQLSRKMLLLR